MSATVIPMRAPDGRFSNRAHADAACSLDRAREIYEIFLAAVCLHQGLHVNEVKRQLKRPGRAIIEDAQWRKAAYARQLALYLANTEHNVPQVRLAAVSGTVRSTVCRALQAIEDVREQAAFDRAVDAIAAEMKRG